MLLDEAAGGRLYTTTQFAEAFENQGGLGSKHTIRDRLGVLATKGFVKFVRDCAPSSASPSTARSSAISASRACSFGAGRGAVDPATGEVTSTPVPVLPSHYKCPQSGAVLAGRKPRGLGLPGGVG